MVMVMAICCLGLGASLFGALFDMFLILSMD